tara:strand:+ start:108 stop:332 length:225 start_codon:yes stop_codon:yes gene_type:complete
MFVRVVEEIYNRIQKNSLFKKLKEYRQVIMEKGFKGFIKIYGWKLVVVVFLYYLIRDSILYILIPYLFAKGLFN